MSGGSRDRGQGFLASRLRASLHVTLPALGAPEELGKEAGPFSRADLFALDPLPDESLSVLGRLYRVRPGLLYGLEERVFGCVRLALHRRNNVSRQA
jgi:hypothetical protein